jgi:hypothetical protein
VILKFYFKGRGGKNSNTKSDKGGNSKEKQNRFSRFF